MCCAVFCSFVRSFVGSALAVDTAMPTVSEPVVTTVSLVSRVPSFCCDGRTVAINTPFESSWSTKLKFVTFDCNRAIFNELDQVIDSAARSVNRIL